MEISRNHCLDTERNASPRCSDLLRRYIDTLFTFMEINTVGREYHLTDYVRISPRPLLLLQTLFVKTLKKSSRKDLSK